MKTYTIIALILLFKITFGAIDLDFSQKRGFYTSSFQLVIEADDPTATIRYTTNQSKPSQSNGTIYSGPITINGTTTLRVIAYNAIEQGNVRTHSYIFTNDVIAQSYMANYIKNNATYGPQLPQALEALPVVSLVTPANTIDDVLEVEGSFEIFSADGSISEQENCGAKLFGFTSVINAQKKSHRIYFRGIYGAKSLEAKLFEGFESGVGTVSKFDQVELRAISQEGFSDSYEDSYTYVGPRFMDDTMLEMGNLHSHGRFVHFYVNGEYRGQYHLRERMNADFMASYLGGDKLDYEAISGSGGGNLGGTWTPGTAYQGTGAFWNSMVNQSNNFDNWKNYINYKNYFDFMLSFMWGNHENEMKAVGNLTDPTKFIFRINDGDGAFTYFDGYLGANIDRTNPNGIDAHNVAGHDNIFKNLYNEGDTDFFMAFADQVECHCFNDGALTPNKLQARIDKLVNEMSLSIVADAARWGSNAENEFPSLWTSQINQVKQNYLPSKTSILIGQLQNRNFYPTTQSVDFNQFGGAVNSGFQLTLSNPSANGDIYYTTDGSDPRLDGGNLNPNAILYIGPTTLPDGVFTVKARIYSPNQTDPWSAMCPRKFYVGQNYSDVVINEIHYNPNDSIFVNPTTGLNDTISGTEFEFVELKNKGTQPVYLADVSFTKGITISLDDTYVIQPGGFLILAEDDLEFTNRYGFAPDGVYQGKLDNGGENLWLVDPFENLIDTVKYNDILPWDTIPDNGLYSLGLIDANLDNGLASSWFSQVVYTTPGEENIYCSPIMNSATLIDLSCNNSADGFINLSISGGTTPYTYLWNTGQTTASISNLAAGTYSVLIKDNYQCELIDSFAISEPALLQINLISNDESYYQANDGSAAATATGGTPPYTYNWSNGASTASINNLSPGNYNLTVNDASNCTATGMVTINPIICNPLMVSVDLQNIECSGDNNGSLDITNIQNGTLPYVISWSNGVTSATNNNLPAGSYSVLITDNLGCTFQNSYTINTPQMLSATVITMDASSSTSFDGAIDVSVNGGTPPYNYYWSNGATTQDIFNLAVGAYWLSISDSNGCNITLINLQVDNGCLSSVVELDGLVIPNGILQVSQLIQSNRYVQAGSIVEYKAGNCIELQNDFEVIIGGEFDAVIDGCQ